MPRPTTKTDLIHASNNGFDALFLFYDKMSEEDRQADFCFDAEKMGKEEHWKRDKNMRDVFIHLSEWHGLLLNWVKCNLQGEAVPFLPKPYSWKSYGQMNVEFWKKHQATTLQSAHNMLKDSHKKVMELLETFSNEELFTKKYYSFTGSTALSAYCISATASHYDWAIKKLKAQIKALKSGKAQTDGIKNG